MNLKHNHEFLNWVKDPNNPVIPTIKGTWRHAWTANPDLLLLGDKYFLYYRGQGTDGKDRLGVMTIEKDKFDGRNFDDFKDNPIIDVGEEGEFDCKYVLDPAALKIKDKIFLYYSGISGTRQEGPKPDSIGLAISDDGFHFKKYEKNPVFIGRSPEIVEKDGRYYLFYLKTKHRGYFIDGPFFIHLAISDDGFHFKDYGDKPILPPGNKGEWDAFTTTHRIYYEDGLYFMTYAGDDKHYDYSKYLGLAASKDLVNWEKYSGNPIFHRGERGEWDEGGIWYATFTKKNGIYYLWYEGYGRGKDRDKSFDEPGYSQIGLATLKGINFKDLFPNL